MEFQLQLNCCVKNFVVSFPEMPSIVADLVEGGPGLERRAEKVAPVSSRKLRGWPPTIRVTRGSCGEMRLPKLEALGPVSLDPGSQFLTPETYIPEDSYYSSDLLCKWGKA